MKEGDHFAPSPRVIAQVASTWILLVLLCTTPALADEEGGKPAKPLTIEQAADAVLEAVASNDVAALKALAAQSNPDPWFVAHEVCYRGDHDAAESFARAALREETQKLLAYVASQRGRLPDEEARRVITAARAAWQAGAVEKVLEAVRGRENPLDSVDWIWIAKGRGLALFRLQRFAESVTVLREAGDAAHALGWWVGAASLYSDAGRVAFRHADYSSVLATWGKCLEINERLGDRAEVARLLGNIGNIHLRLGDYPKALVFHERSLALKEVLGDRARMGGTLGNIGDVHKALGDLPKALSFYERALASSREEGDRGVEATMLRAIGIIHTTRGDLEKALSFQERALALKEALGDRASLAGVLGSIGDIHRARGDNAQALLHYRRALEISEARDDRHGVAGGLVQVGTAHHDLGDYQKALALLERALAMFEEQGDRASVARCHVNIGAVHGNLGDYPQALSFYERALATLNALGNRHGVAHTLGNIGAVHQSLGNGPQALSFYERALAMQESLGDRPGMSTTLQSIGVTYHCLGALPKALSFFDRARHMMEAVGNRAGLAKLLGCYAGVHNSLRDDPRALSCLERGLEILTALDDRRGMARALLNLGTTHMGLGDLPQALSHVERALALKEELGDRAGVAIALESIALIHRQGGDYEKALAFLERALAISEELGRRDGVCTCLANIAPIHAQRGDYQRALDYTERALALAREMGDAKAVLHGLSALAWTHLALDDAEKALVAARSAVGKLGQFAGGLAEEQGAQARERFSSVFETGLRAGVRLQDPAEVGFYLESGRAGSLLEFLGGRKQLQAFLVPEVLRGELARARAAESVASHALTRALDRGGRKEARTCRAALQGAREKTREVIQRVQREAKAAADVLYPAAASLEEIIARMEEGEALVLYALTEWSAVALVVTAKAGRIVSLGEPAKVREAIEAAEIAQPGEAPTAAIEGLRRAVLEPLDLPEGTTRLLVSPHGALSAVPFALLIPGEVAYVPSGTTYGVLLDERARKGESVLALGDPDYSVTVDPQAVAAFHRGGRLTPLPATMEEAKEIGDVVLLRKDATEARLVHVLGTRTRWRAIHLACHGLVEPQRAIFSSLALTPDDRNDGFLTCLEVFRMKIPADLVVLSACETARGQVYEAEGIMGLTRAFMMAGAPRVLCSLWKVDDAATRALMVKFYELWNPKEGKALGAAAALKQAQSFVKSHEEWEHPYYWAAWVLWGLPE